MINPLSFSPKGERYWNTFRPWGKAGKGVIEISEEEKTMKNNVYKMLP
jgi:hypothetical protein